jgi:hypothetical protein
MRFRTIALVVLALAVAVSSLCVRWRRQARLPAAQPEGDVVVPEPVEPGATASPPDPVPAASDLQAMLDRVFERSLTVDREIRPSFVTGDFTGDAVTDLAVAVRPRDAASLAVLNAELPRWRLQDAGDAQDAPHPVTAGERLLAVVHGVAGSSWDGSDDRPCYLVRNAVGPGMRARPLHGVPPAIRMRVTRAHAGDVIYQERSAGRGLLWWTGAAYAWADLPSGPPVP